MVRGFALKRRVVSFSLRLVKVTESIVVISDLLQKATLATSKHI